MVSYSLNLVVKQTERKAAGQCCRTSCQQTQKSCRGSCCLGTRNDLSGATVDRVVFAKHSVLALIGSLHGVRVCGSLRSSVVGTV